MKAVLLTGPSGSGKTTLAQKLVENFPSVTFSISATTRPPRSQEVHGRDYYFLSEADFDAEIARGGFVEWERLFSGYRYGTLRSEIERIQSTGQIPLFVKDVRGTLSLKTSLGEGAISVFLLPPSLEELRSRLIKRGMLAGADLEERIQRAHAELCVLPRFDFILYNENLEKAFERLVLTLSPYLS
ncbi:MAG: guanylate kinase [Bacteroidia bacterium]|nr:guanylate kinase [Bacteroidia bacterium]MDW8235476.1 guanylate kinase [Bacteroidia bacterium]